MQVCWHKFLVSNTMCLADDVEFVPRGLKTCPVNITIPCKKMHRFVASGGRGGMAGVCHFWLFGNTTKHGTDRSYQQLTTCKL